jgi:arylsulfatase A-like enzyme
MKTTSIRKIAIGISAFTLTGGFFNEDCSAEERSSLMNSAKKPNILFISVDDLRPVISVYGDKIAKTPNFERLAKYGITFNRSYCQQALSGPTRASLLTGLRPDNIGVWTLQGNFRKNNPQAVTLPELLKNNGYETVGIGKIFHPLDNLKFRNDPQSWSMPYIKTSAPAYMIAQGRKATECADVPDHAYEDGLIALAGVEKLKELSNRSKPFFLAVGFKKPHAPYVAPKRYWDLYQREEMPLAEYQQMSSDPVLFAYHPSNELKVYSDIPPFHSYEDTKHLDTATQKRIIHAYYACVSYIDAQIGKLLDELESQGIAEETVIILWSDHGYHLGDHGLWNKLTNFENSTRSALMICAPEYKRNMKTNAVTEFVDLFPTICDLAGIEKPGYLDGESLINVLRYPEKTKTDYAFGQFSRGNIYGYSCRDKRFRLVEWVENFRTYLPFEGKKIAGIELYDYQTDPLETKNLAFDPKYKNVLDKMRNQLHRFYREQFERSKHHPVAAKFPLTVKEDIDEDE